MEAICKADFDKREVALKTAEKLSDDAKKARKSTDWIVDGGAVATPTYDWRPPFRAWLEGDSLRTTGVCDDMAAEIIKLTAVDLPLQRRLLKLHCGVYHGPWWKRLVERWQKRAGKMEYDSGLSREEAERQAAECLRVTAFLDELRNQQ